MKLNKTLAARELAKRGLKKEIVLAGNFPEQNSFINDPARYISAQCSRRAGKSNGLAIKFIKTMERHPGSQCIYVGLTRESAKEIMVEPIVRVSEEFGLSLRYTESNLTFKHSNGSTLKLVGADGKNFIRKLKGRKYAGVGIDEAQDFGSHLESLVDDVLTPATLDYEDGWIALTGTPGPVPAGYFFEVTSKGKYNFSRHEWTLLQNPHVPNPEQFIADLIIRKAWEPNSPTLLREYRNKWVLDVQSLWIQYNESKNDFKTLPSEKFNYILGIDIGYKDADALAVLGWSESSKKIYLIEEIITKKQDLTGLVEQIKDVTTRYDVSKMVIDQGGLGLKMAEEIRRRHHIPVVGAEKQRKQENVEFLNDYLRTGNFMARKESRFAKDSYLVQIDWDKSTPERIVVKKQPHSDIIDAVLYAFKESPAYTYERPIERAKPNTPKWYTEEEERMEEAAQEHFDNQQRENALYKDEEDYL